MTDLAPPLTMAPSPEQACLNCGTSLVLADQRVAHFCPDCGQETDPRPPTVVELFRQLISHYASVEGRLRPTLVGLIAKPGFLTREYFAGRRRRYIIPTRLYLSASLLFFIVVKLFGAGSLVQDGSQATNNNPRKTAEAMNKALETAKDRAKDVKAKAELAEAARALRAASRDEVPAPKADAPSDTPLPAPPAQVHPEKEGQPQQGQPSIKGRFPTAKEMDELPVFQFDSGKGNMDQPFLKSVNCSGMGTACEKLRKYMHDKYGDISMREFGRQVKARTISYAPYAMFMLLPVFAIITRLLYWRRGFLYAEHMVYALHVHSFAFLLLLTASLIPKPFSDVAFLVGMVYFWMAMQRVFGGRWWATAMRYAFIGLMYPILMFISILFVFLLAIFF